MLLLNFFFLHSASSSFDFFSFIRKAQTTTRFLQYNPMEQQQDFVVALQFSIKFFFKCEFVLYGISSTLLSAFTALNLLGNLIFKEHCNCNKECRQNLF